MLLLGREMPRVAESAGVNSHGNFGPDLPILQRNYLESMNRSPSIRVLDLGAVRHRGDLLREKSARVADIHT